MCVCVWWEVSVGMLPLMRWTIFVTFFFYHHFVLLVSLFLVYPRPRGCCRWWRGRATNSEPKWESASAANVRTSAPFFLLATNSEPKYTDLYACVCVCMRARARARRTRATSHTVVHTQQLSRGQAAANACTHTHTRHRQQTTRLRDGIQKKDLLWKLNKRNFKFPKG